VPALPRSDWKNLKKLSFLDFSASSYADYNWDNSVHNYDNSLYNPKALIFYSTKDKPKGYVVKKENKLVLFDFKGNCKGYIKERGKI